MHPEYCSVCTYNIIPGAATHSSANKQYDMICSRVSYICINTTKIYIRISAPSEKCPWSCRIPVIIMYISYLLYIIRSKSTIERGFVQEHGRSSGFFLYAAGYGHMIYPFVLHALTSYELHQLKSNTATRRSIAQPPGDR